LRFCLVRISHKAALDNVGRAGERRQCSGDQPAGTGFGGSNMPPAHPTGIENGLREGKGFSFKHQIFR